MAELPIMDRSSTGKGGRSWPGARGGDGHEAKPATIEALLLAIARVGAEAVSLAGGAYEAIQHHAFDPYRQFCEKRAEHAALVSVLRARIGPKPKDPKWAPVIDLEDSSLRRLSIQACVKFAFALSATPLMPLGARETFMHEVGMLQAARAQLQSVTDDESIASLLDELEMALMILEEVVEKAPAFEEF
jgi:hypothetical protein